MARPAAGENSILEQFCLADDPVAADPADVLDSHSCKSSFVHFV